jgi:hypothetical protein
MIIINIIIIIIINKDMMIIDVIDFYKKKFNLFEQNKIYLLRYFSSDKRLAKALVFFQSNELIFWFVLFVLFLTNI